MANFHVAACCVRRVRRRSSRAFCARIGSTAGTRSLGEDHKVEVAARKARGIAVSGEEKREQLVQSGTDEMAGDWRRRGQGEAAGVCDGAGRRLVS